MSYEDLDSKGIQVVNRLSEFLASNEITLNQLFEGRIAGVEVKTEDDQTHTIAVIDAGDFFATLKKIGVRGSSSIIESLIYFLCIDQEYPQALVLAKLAQALEDFQKNDYYKSFGTKRRLIGGKLEEISQDEAEAENASDQQKSVNEANEESRDESQQPSVPVPEAESKPPSRPLASRGGSRGVKGSRDGKRQKKKSKPSEEQEENFPQNPIPEKPQEDDEYGDDGFEEEGGKKEEVVQSFGK